MQAQIKRMIETLSAAGMEDGDIVLSLCAICPSPTQLIVLLSVAEWDMQRLRGAMMNGPPEWKPGVAEQCTQSFMSYLALGGMSDGECLHSLFCSGIPPVIVSRIVAICDWSFERTVAAIDVAMMLSGVAPDGGPLKYN